MVTHAADICQESLLTVKDVAEILCMGVRTVWKAESSGEIPKAVRINKKTVRWKASAIQAFLDKLGPHDANPTQDALPR